MEIGVDSALQIGADLDVGGASPGTIRLLADSSNLSVGGSVVVGAGGNISGVGTLVVNGPRIVNSGGSIAPGLSPGTLTIDGNLEQSEGGTLIMEAAGLEPGQLDVLNVRGAVTLGGTLEVRFLDGFLPREGDTLDFVQADGGLSGDFAKVAFPDLAPGFDADLQLRDNRLRLVALNDAAAGEGMTLAAPSLTAQPVPNACGIGVCGAGFAPMLAVAMLCLHMARRTRAR